MACAAILLFAACSEKPKPQVPSQAGAPAEAQGELAQTAPIASAAEDLFEDVTPQAGLGFVHQFCDTRIANIIESSGAGAGVLDFDNDGWMDIYLVNSGPLETVTHHRPGTKREPNRLYRNLRNGKFEDATTKAGVAGAGFGVAVAAADYDNDGDSDLYLVNVGKNILYRNRGDGTFEDATESVGVGDAGTGIGAAFVDVDNDGRLDLFVANYLTFDPNYQLYFNPDAYPGPTAYKSEFNVLYRNRGDGTFEDISEKSGIRVDGHRAMSVSVLDFDKNGTQDLYVCNDATPNLLLVNDGTGRFEEKGAERWVAFNALGEAAGSMMAAVGDCNGDQHLDMLVSRLGYGSLYMGSEKHSFTDAMITSGLAPITAQYVGWGTEFLDFDNDGDLDVFVANGDPHHPVGWESLLLENDGTGKFSDAVAKGGAYFRTKIRARGSAVADFDNDGRVDILVTALGDRAFLLRNRGLPGQERHWIVLDLEGVRSNRDGFGAKITVWAGGQAQYLEAGYPSGFLGVSDRRVHAGLGRHKTAEKIEIHWPSGVKQTLENVSADQILKIKEM